MSKKPEDKFGKEYFQKKQTGNSIKNPLSGSYVLIKNPKGKKLYEIASNPTITTWRQLVDEYKRQLIATEGFKNEKDAKTLYANEYQDVLIDNAARAVGASSGSPKPQAAPLKPEGNLTNNPPLEEEDELITDAEIERRKIEAARKAEEDFNNLLDTYANYNEAKQLLERKSEEIKNKFIGKTVQEQVDLLTEHNLITDIDKPDYLASDHPISERLFRGGFSGQFDKLKNIVKKHGGDISKLTPEVIKEIEDLTFLDISIKAFLDEVNALSSTITSNSTPPASPQLNPSSSNPPPPVISPEGLGTTGNTPASSSNPNPIPTLIPNPIPNPADPQDPDPQDPDPQDPEPKTENIANPGTPADGQQAVETFDKKYKPRYHIFQLKLLFKFDEFDNIEWDEILQNTVLKSNDKYYSNYIDALMLKFPEMLVLNKVKGDKYEFLELIQMSHKLLKIKTGNVSVPLSSLQAFQSTILAGMNQQVQPVDNQDRQDAVQQAPQPTVFSRTNIAPNEVRDLKFTASFYNTSDDYSRDLGLENIRVSKPISFNMV